MPPCVTGFAVLSVLALGLLSACGANDGQVSEDRPSATTSLSPTRTFPSPTGSPEAPDQTKPESPRPSRSSALPPDTTKPDNSTPGPSASSTRRAEPTQPHPTVRTSTVIAVPVASAGPSPTPSPLLLGRVRGRRRTRRCRLLGGSPGGDGGGRNPRNLAPRASAQEAELADAVWRPRERGGVVRVGAHTAAAPVRVGRTGGRWVGGRCAAGRGGGGPADHAWSPRGASQEDAASARQLRDAVRSAREKVETLSGPGTHDEWALDLDDAQALLVTVLGPMPADGASASPSR